MLRPHLNIPSASFGFHKFTDGRFVAAQYGVMANTDHSALKINIAPLQTDDLASTHPRLKGNQAEQICPRAAYRVQKPL